MKSHQIGDIVLYKSHPWAMPGAGKRDEKDGQAAVVVEVWRGKFTNHRGRVADRNAIRCKIRFDDGTTYKGVKSSHLVKTDT